MHEEASSRKSGPCELFALWWRWSRIEPEDDQREVPFAEVCAHVLVRSRRVFFVTVPCLRLPCLLLLFFSLCLLSRKVLLLEKARARRRDRTDPNNRAYRSQRISFSTRIRARASSANSQSAIAHH